MKYIGYMVFCFLVAVYAAVLNGWTFSVLWEWFIVDTFGLPVLSVPSAIGVALVVTFLTVNMKKETSENDGVIWALIEALIKVTVKCLICLFSGFIAFQFV